MAIVKKKHSADQDEEIIEKGDIFFFYRPRVEQDEAEGLQDIQRFFMVLKPEGGPFRIAVLGRKRLPDADRHERLWGFIDRVVNGGSEVEAELKEQHYTTKTRGERTLPAARPAGEGVYALIRRGRNLYLTYELELPERPGEVQQELNIGARTDPERAYDLDIRAEHETAENADIFRRLKLSRRERSARIRRPRNQGDADLRPRSDGRGTRAAAISGSAPHRKARLGTLFACMTGR